MNYEIYSAIAQAKNKNNQEFDRILTEVDCFDEYPTLLEVKNYLLKKYGIKGNVDKFSLWRDCYLSVSECSKYLQIKLVCKNETKLYYYNKEY